MQIIDRPEIATADLLRLYASVGWEAYVQNPRRLSRAIEGSDFVAAARDSEGVVQGLIRTISDRSSICFVQDLLVSPEQQRRGIGRALLTAVLDHYRDVPRFVLLTDHGEDQAPSAAESFYRELGWSRAEDLSLRSLVWCRPE